MRQKIKAPKFKNEAEEAKWWFENRAAHSKQLGTADTQGKAVVLTRQRLLERIESAKKKASPVVSLRIAEADLRMAREQAEKKGLPYQTYIKSLLHETLVARSKKASGW